MARFLISTISLALLCFSHFTFADKPTPFFKGVDLSYVNQMEDCGAQFKLNNKSIDPYKLFAQSGANLVRVRLWHTPDWTNYSNFDDALKTLQRAQNAGMATMLDLHYSDTWADPKKQFIPKAWQHLHSDDNALANAVYQYTQEVLNNLKQKNVLPTQIQIGNEINSEILQLPGGIGKKSINWPRNAKLINAGLKAVDDFNSKNNTHIQRVLHIAQIENAVAWFSDAQKHQISDFEIIGISYYSKWTDVQLNTLDDALTKLQKTFNKDVMIVETAYPWTLKNFDKAGNILTTDSLVDHYPATPEGQKQYFDDMLNIVKKAGGLGVIYWEPAWVSTPCKTLWGQGSHWDNATMFDQNNNALPIINSFN